MVCSPPTSAMAAALCASCLSTYHSSQWKLGTDQGSSTTCSWPTRSMLATAEPNSRSSTPATSVPPSIAATSGGRPRTGKRCARWPANTAANATASAPGLAEAAPMKVDQAASQGAASGTASRPAAGASCEAIITTPMPAVSPL
jgi:hypothetical protein